MQLSTHVVDSSRCKEHIINSLQHRVNLIEVVKNQDSMEPNSRSHHLKAEPTEASDQCLSVGREPVREPKLSGLTIC
jgi:hypothetical protein